MATFKNLLTDISACRICADHLPHGPRPVIQANSRARILIAGQAPGRRVHESGIPFDDPSGDRLRDWMGISKQTFYDSKQIAIVPMGFCYPGTGRSGDLPPRPECAEAWRATLLAKLKRVELTLVIGRYAIDYHLPSVRRATLTETVKSWHEHGPGCMPLPHPSPRNQMWMSKNPWFAKDVLPALRKRVARILR
jgi:uracil-DNA glycosylase